MTTTTRPAFYAIAIGSNRRGRHGGPVAEVRAAIAALNAVTASAIVASAPVGPSIRRFANAVILLDSAVAPPDLLARLKTIERHFGRRGGQRWGARVIDLDILLWSGGIWSGPGLSVPHPALAQRRFVLDPLSAIAPDWRDPVTRLTIRQLAARARAVDRRPRRP